MGQLHAANRVWFAPRVPHRLSLIAHRRAEIVAAAADPPRKKLLIDHPVRQTFFISGDDLRPLRPERRIEILVAESNLIFFDVTVRINDTHDYFPQATECVLINNVGWLLVPAVKTFGVLP